MLIYLLKTMACLAILILFYKLLLERENMHVFKRFYLLFAVGFSLVVPALVFTEYVEFTPNNLVITAQNEVSNLPNGSVGVPKNLEADVLDIAPILWTVYFIGLFFFGFKFIRNLFQIYRRVKNNLKLKKTRFTQVLLLEKVAPHTFFNFIFLNKKRHEAREIPQEVLLHEETHAIQKHSIDVVLIEFLQVILWVNPLIYFTKKAIKLNHEFLADEAVLKNNIDRSTYQNTLLSYLSPDSEKKYQQMANAINYSSIKKRFTIMKTHTSKKAVLLRSLLLLPLLAILLFGFSETQTIVEERVSPTMLEEYNRLAKSHHLFSDFNVRPQESEIQRMKQIYGLMTIKQKEEAHVFPRYETQQVSITSNETEPIEININKEGELLVQDEVVALEELPQFLSSLNKHLTFEQKEQHVQALIYVVHNTPKNVIKKVNEIVTDYGAATINIVGPKAPTKSLNNGASKEQIVEYNALAKKYNTMIAKSKRIQIQLKDVNRLEYIYELMTEAQKASAVPFPDFPEPPPAPIAPKASKSSKKNKSTKEFKEPKAPKPPKAPKTSTTEKSDLPTPPAPVEPLDHVIAMAKKGATFYFNGKEISSDEAINLMKKDKSINVDSRSTGGKNPVVKLSTAPIRIK